MLLLAGALGLMALGSVVFLESTPEPELDDDDLPDEEPQEFENYSGDLFDFLDEDEEAMLLDPSTPGALSSSAGNDSDMEAVEEASDDPADDGQDLEPDIFDVTEGPAIFWDFQSGVDTLVVMHASDMPAPEISIDPDPEINGQWFVRADGETVAQVEGGMPQISDIQIVEDAE